MSKLQSLGIVDNAHPAAANFSDDGIMGNGSADHLCLLKVGQRWEVLYKTVLMKSNLPKQAGKINSEETSKQSQNTVQVARVESDGP